MKNLKIIIKKNKGFLLLTCFFIFLVFILLFITPSHWTKKTDYRNIAHIFTSITFEQWDNVGAKNYYFAPVISYDNPGDKFVDIYPRVFDSRGNNYYLSHPSGSFLLSYSVLKLFNFPINNLSLQKILFVYFILSIIGVMILLSLLFKKNISIIIGTLIYASHPLILFSFTYYHFAETIGLVFFIWVLVFHMLIIKFPENKLYFILHKILFFCYLLIDWMALIYAIFYIFYNIKKKNKKEAILVSNLTIIAYLMIVIQYSSIGGLQPFINSIWIRYIDRAGIFSNILDVDGLWAAIKEFFRLFFKSIWNVLEGTGILFTLIILPVLNKAKIFKNDTSWQFIIKWVFLPILIFSIIVFSAVLTHYIYMAKFVLFITLTTTFVCDKYLFINNKKWINLSYTIILLTTMLWSLHKYSAFYKYDAYQENLDKQANILKTGANPTDICIYILADNQNINELVYVTYTAKRNLLFFRNISDFNKWYENNTDIDCLYIFNNTKK